MSLRSSRSATHPGDGSLAEELTGLPGGELVVAGMDEVRRGELTEGALLVLIAAPRLRGLGIDVPERNDVPRPYEHRLYELLERTHGGAAYSRYGSLIRRMVSFSQALCDRRRRHADAQAGRGSR